MILAQSSVGFKSMVYAGMLSAAMTMPAMAQPLYAQDDWNEGFLEVITAGPQLLSVDFNTGVKAPSLNNSDKTKNEIDQLIALKSKRSLEIVERIKFENQAESVSVLLKTADIIDVEKYPALNAFFEKTLPDLEYFILRDKMKFARLRPASLNAEIEPVIDNPSHASYPSGHAAQAYFYALVLSDVNPSAEIKYKEFASDVAHHREIAGIHYPSDSAAGVILATNYFNEIIKNDDVKMLLTEAKKQFNNKTIH